MTIEELAKKLCVGKHSSLHVDFNNFNSNYQTAKEAIEENFNDWYDPESFPSPEERQRCIDTNTVWSIQWYPDTPVGFYKVQATTLEAAIAYALETSSGRRP